MHDLGFFKLCMIDKTADENTRMKLAAVRMLIPIWSLDFNCIDVLIEELCEVKPNLIKYLIKYRFDLRLGVFFFFLDCQVEELAFEDGSRAGDQELLHL